MPQNIVEKYANEFIAMESRERVSRPNEVVPISNSAQFTRRSLKHFIESRQKAGNSSEDIFYLLKEAPEVTEHPQVKILNPNQKKYPDSIVLGRYYEAKNKAVMVVLDKGKEIRDIISLHFRKRSDFEKLPKIHFRE